MAAGVPAVRAQLLAAEHSNLSASRSMVQAEVLTRIGIFLTLVSAGLVSLALVGQATKFGNVFGLFAVIVLSMETVVGFLTQLRVFNAGMEDLMYVLAMNRIRGGYLEIDPGLATHLMSGTTDDRAGSLRTYYFLGRRADFSQVGGSSMILIVVVTSALLGLAASAIATTIGLPTVAVVVIGTACGLLYFVCSIVSGQLRYSRFWSSYTPAHPTES